MAPKNPDILILGAGESGIGAAMLARQQGYKPLIIEEQALNSNARDALKQEALPFLEEALNQSHLSHARFLIKSPGIPPWHASVKTAIEQGVKVIGEIEFASWFTAGKLMGITGTNGKTTTATLLYHVMHQEGFDVGLAGNTGSSFARQLTQGDKAYWVLELSSFQLEDIDQYHNSLAILLNITPDHLNRYPGGMPEYRAAKFRITENQSAQDYFIYNYDNEEIRNGLHAMAPQQVIHLPFSLNTTLKQGAFVNDHVLTLILPEKPDTIVMQLSDLPFKGAHQLQNLMAVSIAACVLGVKQAGLKAALKTFKGMPHRMEMVKGPDGITFINDSKGSNLDAVYHALDSTAPPIIWIAGGLDKGNDYTTIKPLVAKKVKQLVALGIDNTPLKQAFEGVTPIVEASSMEEAVHQAYQLAKQGEVVLLSPGCASFDLFRDFTDRGDQFKSEVEKLSANVQTPLS